MEQMYIIYRTNAITIQILIKCQYSYQQQKSGYSQKMRPQQRLHNNSMISSDIKKEFTQFLQQFPSSLPNSPTPKYMTKLKQMIEKNKHQLVVESQDLLTFNHQLANVVFEEFFKYENVVNQALSNLCIEMEKFSIENNEVRRQEEKDKQDKYQVTFDSSIHAIQEASVRDLRCDKLGKLFCFRGTVTRTTQVRPELVVGVFLCKVCGNYSKPVPQQFRYTQPKKCHGINCDKPIWQLDIQKSQVSDFQKIRVQQDPTKIPPGAMPRSMDVILRNENTERGQPGDICKFIGYLCVLPEVSSMLKPGQKTALNTRNYESRGQMMEMEGVQGIKGIKELNYKLIFKATNLIVENNQFREEEEDIQEQLANTNEETKQIFKEQQLMSRIFSRLTEQQIKIIQQFKQNPNLYEDLANSLFPSIFGQSEIKKAILLQLFGGIHKTTTNKISIRGDINILIVGDPSTAKSQFLKAANKFVPRSVYTNGKTTSAAGLTASVAKDQTGTVSIEAGALMLADNGICCIDQFDKMKYADQTAIHEAMQQQTISIAKAGVFATLNARTSILAAANPIYGRYNKSKSLKNNINISAPIMSRFDLFFVVCDETNDNADANLSQFIINMHRNKEKAITTKYEAKYIKIFISTAKKLKPRISHQAAELLRKYYIQLRERDKAIQNTSYRVTVRQLQSMIRISEALARLNLDPEIKGQYVKEAYRLITTCIMKLQKLPIVLQEQQIDEGQLSKAPLIRGDVALQRELEHKRKQKANKQVSISFQEYNLIQRNVVELFKKREQIQSQSDEQIQIDQQALVNYLLGVRFEAGMIENQEQSNQMKKIINAVIKKLIREERMLMIVEDSNNPSERILRLHPNFVGS